MYLVVLACITFVLGLIILVAFSRKKNEEVVEDRAQNPPERPRNVPRRIRGSRNFRHRFRANPAEPADDEGTVSQDTSADIEFPDKVGSKKRAKLEAKAEKKAQREADERLREEQKRIQEINEAERQKEEERAALERKVQEEAERLAREEKERQEHEEYMKMKAAFNVEEEGFDEGENDNDNENLLQEFVNYMKNAKIVAIEDLATKFKLKAQSVIDRINNLLEAGTLTGVIDDRGKFIYISESEMKDIAKFINQHGRVTLSELVANSDRLVHLKPSDE